MGEEDDSQPYVTSVTISLFEKIFHQTSHSFEEIFL